MRHRRLLAGFAIAALVPALAACGSDDSDEEATTEPTVEESTATSEKTTETTQPSLDGIEMDVTVQFAGFSYELTEATLDETDFGNTITVQARVQNLGDGAATPYPTTSIRLGEEEGDIEVTGDYDFSEIPGGGNGRGELSYVIDEDDLADFDLSTAQLTIGSGDEARIIVPLDGSEDELVTRVPQVQEFTGDIVAGGITFTVEETLVRWDWEDRHSQIGSERALLELSGMIANTAEHQICPEGGMVLTLPDGIDVTVEDFIADSSCVGGGETLRDVVVTFEIDDPEGDGFPGDYELNLGDDDWGPDRTPAQAETVTLALEETEGSADDAEDEGDDATSNEDDDEATTEEETSTEE
jgi:hypothetical protein